MLRGKGLGIGQITRRQLAAILAVSVASLGPALAQAAGPDQLNGIHKVGVIAVLGETVNVGKVGLTVFDSTGGDLSVKDWNLDRLATIKAIELISGRFQAAPVEVDKSRFITDQPQALYPTGNPFLRPLIKALPAGAADAYLVIREANWYAPYPERVRYFGLGAVKDRFLRADGPSVYASYDVDLVEAATGKTLIHAHSSLDGKFQTMSAPEDPGDWADKPSRMSPKQVDALRANLSAVIASTLTRTLTAMKLTEAQDNH